MAPKKRCTKCGEYKHLLMGFHRSSVSKDGRRTHCKQCCAVYKDTDNYRAKNAAQKRARPVEVQMLVAARERAKKKGLYFAITVDDIRVPNVCPLLDIPLVRNLGGEHGSMSPNSPTLDRKNPNLGYVQGNVWVISWRANRLKSDGTADEHRLLAQRLTENGL